MQVNCTYDPPKAAPPRTDAGSSRRCTGFLRTTRRTRRSCCTTACSTEAPGERTGEALDDLNPASREVLTDCKVEAALTDTTPGQVVQFERLGYFCRETHPDAGLTFHRTVGLRDEWAAIQKRQGG